MDKIEIKPETDYRKIVNALPQLSDPQLEKLSALIKLQKLIKRLSYNDLEMLEKHINYVQAERHIDNRTNNFLDIEIEV